MEDKTIWTIGYSTWALDEFIAILHAFKIELIADVRNYPGSTTICRHCWWQALRITILSQLCKHSNLASHYECEHS